MTTKQSQISDWVADHLDDARNAREEARLCDDPDRKSALLAYAKRCEGVAADPERTLVHALRGTTLAGLGAPFGAGHRDGI